MSEIRVRNDTGRSLDVVRAGVIGGGEPVSLGPLPPGHVSDWEAVDEAQRYPVIEASGPGADLVHRPYERTAALPEGRYTYVLRIESDRLVVGLEPDE